MAVTEQSYTGNGSTTNYSFTFPYLKSTDIEVQVDAAVTTAWSLANATTVQFNTAPVNGAAIKILRDTNVDNLTATFYAGSAIKSEDLNDNYTQNLYVTQEIGNRSFQNTGTSTMIGNLRMGEDTTVVFEGATDNAHETTLTVVDPTADRTITLPNVTGTVVTTGDTGTVTSAMIADLGVGTADLVNSSVTTGKIAADNITGALIADDQIDSEHYVDGSIDLAHLSSDSVDSSKIVNDSIVNADIKSDAAIAQSKLALDADLTNLSGCQTGASAALAALTEAEVQALDGLTASTAELNLTDGVTATTAELNYVDGVTSAIQTQIDGKQPLDADLTSLSSMQTGAAAKVALLTADEVEKIDGLTSSTAELNKLDGVTASATDLNITASMTKQTTISDSDTSYPTSGAVVDYFASAIQPFGGIEVIADEDNFPTSIPASGVVISITDASGVEFNGSGASTTARTAGNGSDNVTINGAPASLYSETLASGVGLQVTSTGSSNTYNFHRVLATPADVKQLSDDINDFNSRYRIASSAPGSANDEGDLYFDTGSNKMFVYDGSAWGEVTSTGDFKYLVLCNAGTTNAATYNGSDVSYDLKENTTGGSAASITNAAQLMVSVNGVIQKPNTGTSTGGLDGFVMTDADTIKFTAGPPANAEVFVIQSGSALAINTPGDNTVTAAKTDMSIVQGDVIYGSGTDAWARLPAGTNGYYLKTQGSGANPVWAAVSQYSTPLTTRGDILFRDASGDQRLAKGTDGQYLKIGANDPVWADVVGAVADGCIFENDQTISNNYTIASGKGAHSVGPITVNATVTVNGNWVVS